MIRPFSNAELEAVIPNITLYRFDVNRKKLTTFPNCEIRKYRLHDLKTQYECFFPKGLSGKGGNQSVTVTAKQLECRACTGYFYIWTDHKIDDDAIISKFLVAVEEFYDDQIASCEQKISYWNNKRIIAKNTLNFLKKYLRKEDYEA